MNDKTEEFLKITLKATQSISQFTLYNTITSLKTLGMTAFETFMEKGENAGNQHFLLFPQGFPHKFETNLII